MGNNNNNQQLAVLRVSRTHFQASIFFFLCQYFFIFFTDASCGFKLARFKAIYLLKLIFCLFLDVKKGGRNRGHAKFGKKDLEEEDLKDLK